MFSSFDFSLDNLRFFFNAGNVVIFLLSFLIIKWGLSYWSRPSGLPPGPWGLPIVGYLPFLGDKPYVQFQRMGQKYGNIFSFYLGGELAVVLNDYKAINEAFVMNAEIFSGRNKLPGSDLEDHKFQNLVNSDGDHWKQHRRFALSTLNQLGLAKSSMEPQILYEMSELCEVISRKGSKPQYITDSLGLSITNIVCAMIFGKRFSYDDEFVANQKRIDKELIARTDFLSPSFFFPWILKTPLLRLLDRRSIFKTIITLSHNVAGKIVASYKNVNENAAGDSYISMYLAEKIRREKSSGQPEKVLTDEALVQNVLTLFAAGSETITTTITFGLIYLLNNPEVQDKLHKEIDANIGSDRLPSYTDRIRTPFVEATILEILRMSSIVPNNVVHRNLKNVNVGGFTIPKDSYIISNLWNVHHSPTEWKDPEHFKPERFLSETNELIKPENLIPFSIGKRQCLGEAMARMELYLCFATLLQKFTFKMAPGEKPPAMHPAYNRTAFLSPQYFEVCCISRH